MFPDFQTRARKAFAGAFDRAIEFATLGEYRYLEVEREVANNSPAGVVLTRRAAATRFSPPGPASAADPGTSVWAASSSPRSPRRSPRTSGTGRDPGSGRASAR